MLAEQGRTTDKVPACLTCHDKANTNPAYPKLSGQNSAYLRQQLVSFQTGTRGGSNYAHLMTNTAKKLSPEDIEAAAVYFSRRESIPQ